MKTQCQWWALKLVRVTAVPEGAPEGGTRELASDEPLCTGPQGPNLKGTAKRAHVVHWPFSQPCMQSALPPPSQSWQRFFLFLPPLTPRHVQNADASGQSLQNSFRLPRKMPWHRAAGGHERKRRRRAAATHLPCSQMADPPQSLQYCFRLPRKMPWHRAAGGHERKRRRRAEVTHLPCSHSDCLYFFGPT